MLPAFVNVAARTRLVASALIGVAVGLLAGALGTWQVGLLAGWMAASATFVGWMWSTMWPMDGDSTARHAVREDAGRPGTDFGVVAAAVASLGAVGLLLLGDTSAGAATKDVHAVLGVVSVALAWGTLHTLYTAKYARLYYTSGEGGVDFHQQTAPRYADFAYLAFTIGMTFQVSDTELTTHEMRSDALRHGLLSYLFGAVIIATMINLVAGLSR